MNHEPHRIHSLPMPQTRALCRMLRRQVGDEAADELCSVFDEIVTHTLRGAAPADAPDPSAEVDRLVGVYAPLRSRWLEAARAATRPEHLLDLHVAAFMTAGQQSDAVPTRRARRKLGDALETVPAVIDLHESVLIRRLPLDAAPLRALSTRFDWCVTAAIASASGAELPGLARAIPLLCDEANAAVRELKARVREAADIAELPERGPAHFGPGNRPVRAECPN